MTFSQEPHLSEDAKKQRQLRINIAKSLSLTGTQGSADEGSTSAFGGNNSMESQESPLSDAEILASYVEHYRRKLSTYRSILSTVIDQPDFQPVSFFNLGLERSSAVCRITRYYSRKTLERILEDRYNKAKLLQKEAEENGFAKFHQSSDFNAAEELKISFAMPDSVFREIFPDNDPPLDVFVCLDHLRKPENVMRLLQLNPLPLGTGFLVGGSHLMTNQHVIPSAEVARQCVAQFSYEDSPRSSSIAEYEFAPDLLFVSSPQLDYTLVQLKPNEATRRAAGYRFGWLDLVETTEGILPSLKPDQINELIGTLRRYGYTESQLALHGLPPREGDLSGDRVAIIQHPRGRKKEIVLQDNGDVALTMNNLSYRADTDYGSSGSPVFNQLWQLVALTKQATPILEPPSISTDSNKPELKIRWIASVGTRICRVIEDLKKKSVNLPKLSSFIQDFVLTAEQLAYPPLPVALELMNEDSYVNCGNSDRLNTPEAFTLEAWVNKKGGYGKLIDREGHYWVEWRSDNVIKITLFDQGKEIWVTTKNTAPLSENQWYHLAFTWEKRSGEIHIYINGEDQKDANRKEKESNATPASDAVLYLGGTPSSQFLGAIAEVRLWKIARSPSEIQSTYNRRLCEHEPNLAGYWRFQEGEGRLIRNYAEQVPSQLQEGKGRLIRNDAEQVPNQSILYGDPQSNPSTLDQFPYGLAFNNDSYVDCGNSSKFDLSTAITIECWLRCRQGGGVIINKGGGWEENGYSLYRYSDKDDPDNLRIELQNRASEPPQKMVYDIRLAGLSDGRWHHVAVTWEENSKQIRVYFDAQEQTPANSNHLFSSPIGISLLPLTLGGTAKTNVSGRFFTGDLAEVRLWNVARTLKEIGDFHKQHLTPEEIKEHAGALVGYWQLKEGRGDRATNLANPDLPGVIHNPQWLQEDKTFHDAKGAYAIARKPTWLTTGAFPTLPLPSALVSTDGGHVECSAKDSLSTPGDFTVEAWVNHKFGDCLIVSRGKAGSENQFALSWNGSTIQVQLQDGTGTKRTIVKTTQPIPPDPLWHHVAFTCKSDKHQPIDIFLDGRWQDRTTDNFEGNFEQLQSELVIGDPRQDAPYHSIAIAEVRLWNYSCNQDELTANLSRQFIGTEPDLAGCWRLDSGGDKVFNLVSGHPARVHGMKWLPSSSSCPSDVEQEEGLETPGAI